MVVVAAAVVGAVVERRLGVGVVAGVIVDGLAGQVLVGAGVVAGAIVGGLARRVLLGSVAVAGTVVAARVGGPGGVWEASPSTSSLYCFKTPILSFW